jgi:putative transposase
LLHLAERSITAERLVTELEKDFATVGRPPMALRMDNGPELASQALQRFCEHKATCSTSPQARPGTTATSNRSTTAYARNASTETTETPCSVSAVIGDFKQEHNHRRTGIRPWASEHQSSTLPDAATPLSRGLRDQLNRTTTTWL